MGPMLAPWTLLSGKLRWQIWTIYTKPQQHTTSPVSIILYTATVYPTKYAHGFSFAVLCCGYTLTDFPLSIRLTSLALWQSNDCPSASKATLMDMDKYFMWIHYEQLHNHNKAKHNKTVCIFLGIYCTLYPWQGSPRLRFAVQHYHTAVLCVDFNSICWRKMIMDIFTLNVAVYMYMYIYIYMGTLLFL